MTREDRIAWVEAHKGMQIRYAKRDEVEKGRKAFGPASPIPWHESKLYGLRVDYRGRPSIGVQGPINFGLFGDEMHEPWDNLWDVRLASGDAAEDADGEPVKTLDACKRRIAELEEDNRFLTRRIASLGTHVPELWEIAQAMAALDLSRDPNEDFECALLTPGCIEALPNPAVPHQHTAACAITKAREMVKSKPPKTARE